MGRVNEDFKRHLSSILMEVKDPRISNLLSIVRVEVSKDLSYAKILVSAIEGEEKTLESVKGLKSASGFIKTRLASSLKLRKIPDLQFIADNSIEYGAKISRIIENFEYNEPTDSSTEEELD